MATYSGAGRLVARMDRGGHLGGTSRGRWLLGITFAAGLLCGFLASEAWTEQKSAGLSRRLAACQEQQAIWRDRVTDLTAENRELAKELERQ